MPDKRTQRGIPTRGLSSRHDPKLLKRPWLPNCKREYFKREVLMQICDMCKKIATIRREEQIALYHYLVHFELIGSLIVTHNNSLCKENINQNSFNMFTFIHLRVFILMHNHRRTKKYEIAQYLIIINRAGMIALIYDILGRL